MPHGSILYRILDANLDRAREGLRVVEEWCRFGLHQRELTETCKSLRQELAQWHTPHLRSARNTPEDPGTDLTHPREGERHSFQQVLQANFGRVQEALRVLEEYGKLYEPEFAAACKQLRYRVYVLQSEIAQGEKYQRLKQAHLYLITSPHDNLIAQVEGALQGGVTMVQYRDKSGDGDGRRWEIAQALRRLCDDYGALLIINDRVDLTLAVQADGVHLGQQDLPVAVARQLLGPQFLIGCSTTNPTEMVQALEAGADYLGVGPVYDTPTKPGKLAAGLDYVRYAAAHVTIPWFAIGGIDGSTLPAVRAAGAQQVALVRALMAADDPRGTAQELLKLFT